MFLSLCSDVFVSFLGQVVPNVCSKKYKGASGVDGVSN